MRNFIAPLKKQNSNSPKNGKQRNYTKIIFSLQAREDKIKILNPFKVQFASIKL
tara:strand:+ start:339 stop:500 length:162 start_codon:yes stop_codon:yes gene_type:complete